MQGPYHGARERQNDNVGRDTDCGGGDAKRVESYAVTTRDRLIPRESNWRALASKYEENNYPTTNIKNSNRVDGDGENAIDIAEDSSVQEEHRAFDQKKRGHIYQLATPKGLNQSVSLIGNLRYQELDLGKRGYLLRRERRNMFP